VALTTPRIDLPAKLRVAGPTRPPPIWWATRTTAASSRTTSRLAASSDARMISMGARSKTGRSRRLERWQVLLAAVVAAVGTIVAAVLASSSSGGPAGSSSGGQVSVAITGLTEQPYPPSPGRPGGTSGHYLPPAVHALTARTYELCDRSVADYDQLWTRKRTMSKSPAVHGIWMIGALPSRARTGQRAQPAAADRHAAPGGAVPGAAS